MLRIVWGVIFILWGIFLVLQAAFGSVLLQSLSQIIGEQSSSQSNMILIRDYVFGAIFCFGGSLLVYYGDMARQERIERIFDLFYSRRQNPENEGDW